MGHDDGDQVGTEGVAVDVHLVDELGVAHIDLLQPRHAHILTLRPQRLHNSAIFAQRPLQSNMGMHVKTTIQS